jgi:hypothetical protein
MSDTSPPVPKRLIRQAKRRGRQDALDAFLADLRVMADRYSRNPDGSPASDTWASLYWNAAARAVQELERAVDTGEPYRPDGDMDRSLDERMAYVISRVLG